MNLPTNYDTTGKTYNTLTKTQTAFVHYLYEAGFTTKDDVVFNRSYLTTLSNAYGVTWPPAWIVKDTTRCIRRGCYAVPELNDYIALQGALNVSPGQGNEGDDLSDAAYIEDNPQTDVNTQAMEEMTI